MKRMLILLTAITLLTGAAAIPALAEETGGAPDQVTSATVQAGEGLPDNQQQMPGSGQVPPAPGNTGNGQAPQAPAQGSRNGKNSQQPAMPGKDGSMNHGKNSGNRNSSPDNSRSAGSGRNVDPAQLLADGVITREVYDAIMNWLNEKAQQPAVPADPAEIPAAPEAAPESAELQLLKQLLESSAITQEQYNLLSAGYTAVNPEGTV